MWFSNKIFYTTLKYNTTFNRLDGVYKALSNTSNKIRANVSLVMNFSRDTVLLSAVIE